MAIAYEKPNKYRLGANSPSREDVGYKPRLREPKEPNFISKLIQQILYKIVNEESLKKGRPLNIRPPKGDPDSYDIHR